MRYKMNKAVKSKWLKALRSGKFRQGTGKLRYYDQSCKRSKYCCLGVLCAIHAEETGEKFENHEYLNEAGLLPSAVKKWSGLSERGRLNKKVEDNTDLVYLNDSECYSFKDIADVVEKQF